MVQTVILRGYKVERHAFRVGGIFASFWFRCIVVALMALLTAPTLGVSLVLIPIAIGFLRNRPMIGIILWDVFLSFILIGWLVALVKACGNR